MALRLGVVMTISACSPDAGRCDWTDKAAFGDCVRTEFARGPLGTLDAYLAAEGFVRAERGPGEDFDYYQKNASDLSGYRIAVLVWPGTDDVVERIEIR